MPASEFAAEAARQNPGLGVGLHFNLTTDYPLSPAAEIQGLVGPDGGFLGRKALALRIATRKVRSEEVHRELQAQLARMRSLGLSPTHIDSHQHVHAFPMVFGVVARQASELGIPVRLPVRWPGKPIRTSVRRRAAELALGALVGSCRRKYGGLVRTNDGLCSVFDLGIPSSDIRISSYGLLLQVYSAGVVELMVHPARVDADLASLTEITNVSEVEQRLLGDDSLRRCVSALGGRLCTYADAWCK